MAASTQRFADTLVLGAIGDALGAPIEFDGRRSIVEKYGREAPQRIEYAGAAQITDDTQMALFVAEALVRVLEAGEEGDPRTVVDECERSLVDWLRTQERSAVEAASATGSRLLEDERLHSRRAPGNTCLSSCRHIAGGGRRPGIENRINNSKGCGTVMRSAPYGLAADTVEEAFEWSKEAAALTHTHPTGWLSAAYFSALVHELAGGSNWRQAFLVADALLENEPENRETQEAVRRAREAGSGGDLTAEDVAELGEGWVAEEALAIGMAVAMDADIEEWDGIREALWLSVAHSGDSDSTGMVAGNLIGVQLDEDVVPVEWRENLELADRIDEMARALASSR